MAFFKFRFPGHDEQAHHANDTPHESLEALRKRVKHRLIGSGVLVLIAVIGFPLVFDTQPRPVGLDVPIDIPDKTKTPVNVAPTPLKSDKKSVASEKSQAVESANAPHAENSVKALPEPVASALPVPVPSAAQVQAPAPASSSTQKSTPSNAATPRTTEVKNAQVSARTTLDAKEEIVSSSKSQSAGAKSTSSEASSSQKEDRFVIQVGAYSDEQKVKDIREKLEKAGLHTYTQVVDKDGKKIRIRIGPFTSKEEANRQLQKVRSLNLQPNLLTL